MEDTLGQEAQTTRTEGKKALPSSRALTQIEKIGSVQEAGRLMQDVSIGKKGQTFSVKPDEVESLRPAASEMKNG